MRKSNINQKEIDHRILAKVTAGAAVEAAKEVTEVEEVEGVVTEVAVRELRRLLNHRENLSSINRKKK